MNGFGGAISSSIRSGNGAVPPISGTGAPPPPTGRDGLDNRKIVMNVGHGSRDAAGDRPRQRHDGVEHDPAASRARVPVDEMRARDVQVEIAKLGVSASASR